MINTNSPYNVTMKMWYCVFVSLLLVISLWIFSYGVIKTENLNSRTAIELNIVQNSDDEKGIVIFKNSSGILEKDMFKLSNGRVKQHVPKFMLELYEKSKIVKKENLKMAPDIVKSVIPAYEGSHYPYLLENDKNNDHHMLVFNVPNSNKDELFIRAELRILTLIEIKSKLALGIERQIKISLYNETTNELKILEEKHIYHTDNAWISFNVSEAVKTILLENENKILKLVITVRLYQPFINNKTGVFKLSLMPITENYEHNYPVLLLFYTSAKKVSIVANNELKDKNIRVRRYTDEDYEEELNKLWDDDNNKAITRKMKRMRNNCRRRPLYVDFAEIDYDSWIVQPSGYEAYQCWGKCFYPVAEHLSPTKHAIVQALLHSVSPSRAPRSCCVPTKLDSISVLYVDAQGVLTYRYAYTDMVVTECGCR